MITAANCTVIEKYTPDSLYYTFSLPAMFANSNWDRKLPVIGLANTACDNKFKEFLEPALH